MDISKINFAQTNFILSGAQCQDMLKKIKLMLLVCYHGILDEDITFNVVFPYLIDTHYVIQLYKNSEP